MKRIVRNAYLLWAGLTSAGLLGWGWEVALSVAIGGGMATLNFHWLAKGVDGVLGTLGSTRQARLAILKYVGRLLLILVGVFAMIRLSFFSLWGLLTGLAIFVVAGMLEAVLLLFEELFRNR